MSAHSTPELPGALWAPPIDDCAMPDAVSREFGRVIRVGSVMPLSGLQSGLGTPFRLGFRLYLEMANSQQALPNHTVELVTEDDQYNKDLTPGAVEKLLEGDQADFVAGLFGTPPSLAVRDSLNEECVPQLFSVTGTPVLGDVRGYPWTSGSLVPYPTEAAI